VVYACFERVLYRTSNDGVISSMKMLRKLRGQRSPFCMIDTVQVFIRCAISRLLPEYDTYQCDQYIVQHTSAIFRIAWKRCNVWWSIRRVHRSLLQDNGSSELRKYSCLLLRVCCFTLQLSLVSFIISMQSQACNGERSEKKKHNRQT
jgi:hypothetical protein